MSLGGYYINLDRSPDRRARMEAELARVGVDWVKRFAAVDGKQITPGPRCAISPSELACFLSHTQLIESAPEDQYTVIFEDDVELSLDLPLVLHPGQLGALADNDIVLLDCQPYWSTAAVQAMWRSYSRQLVDPRDLHDADAPRRVKGVDIHPANSLYCWGLQAYMVTPKGRKTLPPLLHQTLDRGPPGPIDILVKHALLDGRLKGAVFIPFLASPRLESHTETTMEGRELAADRLAIVSAIRRLFFAGPAPGIAEYVRALRPADATQPIDMLSQLVGQAFAIEALEGELIVG
jgi:hypothetical protein